MITKGIIVITVLISISAFFQKGMMEKLIFNPFIIKGRKEWYRFLSYGLIHADWVHLAINMYVLFSFGRMAESMLYIYFGSRSILYFLLLYIGGIAFSVLFDFGKYKHDPGYSALGASGAVSAVVFSGIILYPSGRISLMFIPIGIPAVVFGIIYLVYSAYMARRANDNTGHNAHFWGAVFGAVYTLILKPELFRSIFTSLF